MADSGDLRTRAERVLGIGLNDYARGADGLPILAASGSGPYLTDTTGQRFIDWSMGWGSMLLGYRQPQIEGAIRDQLLVGTLFSVPHGLEVEVAECLCAMIPSAEMVAFGKNGSDVCAAAARIARAVTGRDGILTYGYHGFHDWCAALNPNAEGVPAAVAPLVYPMPYNDLDALRAIFATHGREIAGVMMEPMRELEPAPGYLAGVRDLVHEHGAVLIFDEMVTGFRLDRGGAQAKFGVTPDLACFGKALSNGMPLAALVGRADLIDLAPRVAYGMTNRGETLALAAARAALMFHERDPIAERVAAIGESVRAGFGDSCARLGVDARLVGHPAMQGFELPDGWLVPFLAECRQRGVFTNGHLLPSTAHEGVPLSESRMVFEAALEACVHRFG